MVCCRGGQGRAGRVEAGVAAQEARAELILFFDIEQWCEEWVYTGPGKFFIFCYSLHFLE